MDLSYQRFWPFLTDSLDGFEFGFHFVLVRELCKSCTVPVPDPRDFALSCLALGVAIAGYTPPYRDDAETSSTKTL